MNIAEEIGENCVNDQQAYELIDRIRSNRSPSDYRSLKSLLDCYKQLSNKVLNDTLEVLFDSSIYDTSHDEETTVVLELHLRTLLAAVTVFSHSKSYLTRASREELFVRLIEFAKFHISDSDAVEELQSNDAESTTLNEKILNRNFNIDFLLGILRDTIHSLPDDESEFSSTVALTPINVTGDVNMISQLRELFSFTYPISSWYSQWKELIAVRRNLIKLNSHKINLEKREADEKTLLERLWSCTSDELKQSQNTLDDTTKDINSLLKNKSVACSLWFGVLDLAQELATTTSSLMNLIFTYYLALHLLQHAPNIYIQSKAIEVLIITSRRHQMFSVQFNHDFQNMLKVFEEISSSNAVKYQKLFHIISQRCLLTQNIIPHQSQFEEIFHQNVEVDDQSQLAIYDLLAAELTCPITQDMSDQFQKLPCGHFLSVQAIKTWSNECQKRKKLFSCCLCRKEFLHEEIQDGQISAMHQSLYQQLVSVKNISTIEYFKNVLGTLTPPSVADILSTSNQARNRNKASGIIKKAHPAYRKAKAAIKDEKYPVAVFWLNRLLDRWPDSYSTRCERAYALKQLGDLYQSICDLNIAVNLGPKKPRAWSLLGSVYQQMGNSQLALFHVTQALKLEPTNQPGLLIRGIVYTRMNRVDDALQDFGTLLSVDPQKMILSRAISSILRTLHLKKLINNHPTNKEIIVECLRKRSDLYFKKDKYKQAQEDLDRLLQLEPKDRDSLLLRGRTYHYMNEFDLAIADFNEALIVDPEDSWILNRRARCYAEMGRQQEAIKDSNTALKLNPSNGFFYTSRSYIVTFFGHLDQALGYSNIALIVDVSDCEYIYRRVWSYFHLQQYADAIHDLNLSAEVDEDNAWRWVISGFIFHFFKSQHDKALHHFDKAIELDPDLMDIYGCRGQLYAFRGEYDKALQDLNHAIEMKPDESYLHQSLGYLFYNMGKYDLALEALNEAERLISGCLTNFQNKVAISLVLTFRGMTNHKLGKYMEALDHLNKAIAIQVDNHEVLPIAERGALYYSMGEFDKALIDLDEALKVTPKNDYICQSLRNAHSIRGAIYLSREQETEAMDEMGKAMMLEPIQQDRWHTFYALPKSCQDQIRQLQSVGLDLLDEMRSEFGGEKIIFDQSTFDKVLSQWEKAFEIDPHEPISSSIVSGLRLMQKYHPDLIRPSQATEID